MNFIRPHVSFYFLLVLAAHNSFAKYDLLDLYEITKAQPAELKQAMQYLDQSEKGADEAFQVYYHILPRMINQYGLKVGCEIGVSFGSHCKRILETTQVEKLYGIDPYLAYGDPTNITMSSLYFDIFYYKVLDKLSIFGSRFELIRDFSVNVASKFEDASLDFIFLDANHTYPSVKADLNAWYRKVRPGGIVVGDDYATSHPGVPQAVNEFFAQRGLKVHLDTEQPRIWWVQKPGVE